MQVALGLLASVLIGSSDFFRARSSGRTTALQTTTVAFLGGAVATALVSPFLGTPTARDSLAAQGYAGQYVLIVPDRELVVHLGKTPAEQRHHVVRGLMAVVDAVPGAASPLSAS